MKDFWVDLILQKPHCRASPEHPALVHGTRQRLKTGHTKFITELPGPLCPTATALEHTLHFIKARQACYWLARQSRCRAEWELRLTCFSATNLSLRITWRTRHADRLLVQLQPPESEYPRMELVICFGLVISFRTCYYEKQIHASDCYPLPEKKSSNDIAQIC